MDEDLGHLSQLTRERILFLGYEDRVAGSLQADDGDEAVVVTDRRIIVTDRRGTYVIRYDEVVSVQFEDQLVLNTALGIFRLRVNGDRRQQAEAFARWLRRLVQAGPPATTR